MGKMIFDLDKENKYFLRFSSYLTSRKHSPLAQDPINVLKIVADFKGTVSRDFRPFFGIKYSIWGPYEQVKRFRKLFCFLKDIQ